MAQLESAWMLIVFLLFFSAEVAARLVESCCAQAGLRSHDEADEHGSVRRNGHESIV